jgi:oligopeptide transport system substrate-binding protein
MGCRQPESLSGDTFKLNIGTEPPTLDPALVSDLISMMVLNNTHRGLLFSGEHGLEPALASRWQRSADGLTYTFWLKPTAKWSDGKPLTAGQFVSAWKTVLTPSTGSPYPYLLFPIKHAEDFYTGKTKDFEGVGVHALNTSTLQVHLNEPVAFFDQIMAFVTTYPVRRDNLLLSSGPFKVTRWDHETQIQLDRNPYYEGNSAQDLQECVQHVQMLMIPEPNTSYLMYENHELDFVESPSSMPVKEIRRLKHRPDYHQLALNGISYLGFNTQSGPLQNVQLRQALAMSFDRSFIPKLFQGGEHPIENWVMPKWPGGEVSNGLGFNPEKARERLKASGFNPARPLTLLVANTTPENRQLAEIAQDQWKQNLGLDVHIELAEWKTFLKRLQQNPPDMYRIQWYADYPDSDSFLSVFLSDSGNNYSHWKNGRYDTWVKKAARTLEPEKRSQLYQQAQKLLLQQDTVLFPLYTIPKSFLLRPCITGFSLNSLNLITLDKVKLCPTTN